MKPMSLLARRSACLLARKPLAVRRLQLAGVRAFSSSSDDKVPVEDYVNGHLLTGHMEYINDMIEKTVEIEKSVGELKNAYISASTIKWTDPAEIDKLFEVSAKAKEEIQAQIVSLRRRAAIARKVFAVDAPDGVSDGYTQEELAEIENIIKGAALHEDPKKIEKQHKIEDEIRKDRARDPEHDW
jgi:hypothetical protein